MNSQLRRNYLKGSASRPRNFSPEYTLNVSCAQRGLQGVIETWWSSSNIPP